MEEQVYYTLAQLQEMENFDVVNQMKKQIENNDEGHFRNQSAISASIDISIDGEQEIEEIDN